MDDDIVVDEIILKNTPPPLQPKSTPKKNDNIQLVELGSSSDEEDVKPSTSSAPPSFVPFNGSLSPNVNGRAVDGVPFSFLSNQNFLELQRLRTMQMQRRLQQQRKRRKSNDYEIAEVSSEGRLLVNTGKPPGDPDVYVAEHLTDILQPHQLGGVKFMYDNIIESLESFQKEGSEHGSGCILAHSMGLGKTLQIITFVEIFFRYTNRRKVIVVCPVNTIQNWGNEFNKWLPEKDVSGNVLRNFRVFLLGDAVKGLPARAQLINEWFNEGGVLLISYDMFKILINDEKRSKKDDTVPSHASAKLFDVALDLAEAEALNASDEEKEKLISAAKLRLGLKEALLSPGPDLVICDEGHQIKNMKTGKSISLNAIRTKRRIVLTGYPLQNNLMEYYCMVNFVRPNYLGPQKQFTTTFVKPIVSALGNDVSPKAVKIRNQRIHILQQKLDGFVQRRTQHLLKKILPDSKEYVILVRKSPIQNILYRAFVLATRAEIEAQNVAFNPLKARTICVKIINHPDLLYNAREEQKKREHARILKERKEQEALNASNATTAAASFSKTAVNNLTQTSCSANTNDGSRSCAENPAGLTILPTPFPTLSSINNNYCSTPANQSFSCYTGVAQNPQFDYSNNGIAMSTPPPQNYFQRSAQQQWPPPPQVPDGGYSSMNFSTNVATNGQQHQRYGYPLGHDSFQQPVDTCGYPQADDNSATTVSEWIKQEGQNGRGMSSNSGPPLAFSNERVLQFFNQQDLASRNNSFPISNFQSQQGGSTCSWTDSPLFDHQVCVVSMPSNGFYNGLLSRQQQQQQQIFNNNIFGDQQQLYNNNNNIQQTAYDPTRNFTVKCEMQESSDTNQLNANNNQNSAYYSSNSACYVNGNELTAKHNQLRNLNSENFNDVTTNSNQQSCSRIIDHQNFTNSQSHDAAAVATNSGLDLENVGSTGSNLNDKNVPEQSRASTSGTNTTISAVFDKLSAATKCRMRGGGRTKLTLAEALMEDDEKIDNTVKLDWTDIPLKNYVTGVVENSTKMLLALSIIDETTKRGEKILFFSSSVLSLNIFETFLNNRTFTVHGEEHKWKKNVNFCRFDGKTTGVERERMIDRFNAERELVLFLISTRAGSLGINLVSANRVIIFDASWNPCDDAQAICRIYRYGQRKRTFIYRLIVNNSMEKAIFNRQIAKNSLQQKVVDHQHMDANVSIRELESLFVYDEEADNVSNDCNTNRWDIEDDLLLSVAKQNAIFFADCPFLHETLMLESEDKLSEEEKLEAELLYERETNGSLWRDEILQQHSLLQQQLYLHQRHGGQFHPGMMPPPFFADHHKNDSVDEDGNLLKSPPQPGGPTVPETALPISPLKDGRLPLFQDPDGDDARFSNERLEFTTPFPKKLVEILPNATESGSGESFASEIDALGITQQVSSQPTMGKELSSQEAGANDIQQPVVGNGGDGEQLLRSTENVAAGRNSSAENQPSHTNRKDAILSRSAVIDGNSELGREMRKPTTDNTGNLPSRNNYSSAVIQQLYVRPYNVAADGQVIIAEDISLPCISGGNVMLRAGDLVKLYVTSDGTYLKTATNAILDASGTIYAYRTPGRLASLSGSIMRRKKATKRQAPAEVIELE